jgi:hypothetical protein
MQNLGYLSGPQVARSIGCGLAGGLGCHGASLSYGGPGYWAGPDWTGWLLDADGETCGTDRSAIAVQGLDDMTIIETTPNAHHSPFGLFQRLPWPSAGVGRSGEHFVSRVGSFRPIEVEVISNDPGDARPGPLDELIQGAGLQAPGG